MGTLSLVALDTDHIKQYVFPTDKLKEIRGASSILDRLNRNEMQNIAFQVGGQQRQIYANGGSGLFVIDTEKADMFCQKVQARYRELTQGAASVTCAIQELPQEFTKIDDSRLLDANLKNELTLLRYRLQMNKNCALEFVTLPSHPFMRTCDACGMRYAEGRDTTSIQDPTEQEARYCASCLEKRHEDQRIKNSIKAYRSNSRVDSPLWDKLITTLNNDQYIIPEGTERPNDFNDFRLFAGTKDYLGLIYADGNNMGTKTEKFTTLREWGGFATTVDNAVYKAVGDAIRKHLPVWNPTRQKPLFPFDLLLLGGDDIVMVVPAAKALHVAHTLTEQFHSHTDNKYTLSVGVVLAPVKYPFNLQRTLAEETLQAAKKAGSSQAKSPSVQKESAYINFMVITGSTSLDYQKTYRELHRKKLPYGNPDEFYATLRPYTPAQLANLLEQIKDGNKAHLGRTKLHQLREAILKLNRTTTILESLALLRNWKHTEREFIEKLVNVWDTRSPQQKRTETLFPWYRKLGEENTYCTPLLDFIELYDFVAAEGLKIHDPH